MPEDDDCLRWRISIPARPERIDTAEDRRKAVLRAIEVYGAGFAVVCRQDAKLGTLPGRQSVADLGHGLDKLPPTKLFHKIVLNFARHIPPFGPNGSNRQNQRAGDGYVRDKNE